MKKTPIAKVKINNTSDLTTLRNTMKAVSDMIGIRYRVRTRKNSRGKYASVQINQTES